MQGGDIISDTLEPRAGICKTAKVLRVEDADTIEVSVTWKFSVRIIGPGDQKLYLDAPAKNTPEGQEAMSRVVELLTNPDWYKDLGVTHRFKDVKLFIPEGNSLELMDINSFSRILGEIWVDGQRLGDILLEEGLAVLREK